MSDIKAKMQALRDEINKHNQLYYVEDAPEVSDAVYDSLFRELRELEEAHPEYMTKDSPTLRVGGMALASFSPHTHIIPMLSIDNAMNAVEAANFNLRVREELACVADDVVYSAEPKFDGLACSIIYLHGVLDTAGTRGDGSVGEDVTAQVRTIKNVPLNISGYFNGQPVPERIEVRGEVVMPKSVFNKLNEQFRAEGKKEFANPRNAAAGGLRQLDPKKTAKRELFFYAYAMGECSQGLVPNSQLEVLALLKDMGFTVSEHSKKVEGSAGIQEYFEYLAKERNGLNFDIDGTVFKVDRADWRETLGWVGRCPRWAIAYKFPPEEAVTEVLAIDVQIGRTGAATPVARLKPVKVGGVTVTNATLHNLEDLRRKDVRVGDFVVVSRAGDVIPQVDRVMIELRKDGLEVFHMPEVCPVCQSLLEQKEDEVAFKCTGGLACAAQVQQALVHFASRNTMNIEDLGEVVAADLVANGLVKHLIDVYSLTPETLMTLDGIAEKSANKLYAEIQASKKDVEFAKFLYAIGIPRVGAGSSKELANHFRSWEAFRKATQEELTTVEGPATAKAILQFFRVNGDQADALAALMSFKAMAEKGNKLQGMSILITGTLSQPRSQVEVLIEAEGGKLASSVSKKTSAVLIGANPTASKVEKANTLGIPVWTEEDLKAKLA